MSQKILITKPGKDISSQVLDDFYLDSDYPLLKVHSYGTFSIDSAHGSTLQTVTHNLGYLPYVIVFSQFINEDGSITNEYYQQDWDLLLADGSEIAGYTYTYTDRIEIRVFSPGTSSRSCLGFYYIFEQQL